jgi:hypothetical protein
MKKKFKSVKDWINNPQLIRGKTVKEWAEELKISIARAYQLNRKNQLESKIDGTWVPGKKPVPVYFGKSKREWAETFNVPVEQITYLIKIKKLNQAIETGNPDIRKPIGRMILGKNLAQWAKELNITRERARQLANADLLLKRIKNLNKQK